MNTINPVENNITFNSRYLNVNKMENLPPRIYDAVLKNQAIDEYIKAGEPKTLLGKIINLFRSDEAITVTHDIIKTQTRKKFSFGEILYFYLEKKGKRPKIGELLAWQTGEMRKPGSVPKIGENPLFKAPANTAENQLIQQLEKLKDAKDFETLLK
jgi:hypothetical protein